MPKGKILALDAISAYIRYICILVNTKNYHSDLSRGGSKGGKVSSVVSLKLFAALDFSPIVNQFLS
jgi:hypothetical protein